MSEETTPKRKRKPVAVGKAAAMLAVLAFMVFAALAPNTAFGSPLNDSNPIDELWVVTAAVLVFLMQAGFLCFEVGLARSNHMAAVAMKNLVDWSIVSLIFTFIGFGLMFGATASGLVGTDLFGLIGINSSIDSSVSGPTFFLFQLAFAGTAVTIVSGALVERTTFLAYVLMSALIALVIYPVYGHWVWASLGGGGQGWLEAMGFHDFAGGTVVHMVGGAVALMGIMAVGPRIGRFDSEGNGRTFAPSNIGMTALGVLILWVGWWGFNGGSILAFDVSVGRVILMTNLAGGAGLIAAGTHAYFFQNRSNMNIKLIGGALTGLVAITPGADVVGTMGAVAIGIGAGLVHNLAVEALDKAQIDDALGAVPVHLAGGAWGTIALALFAPLSAFEASRIEQVSIQVIGVVVCLLWSCGVASAGFRLIARFVGIRVSPERELGGLQSWQDTDTTEMVTDEELDELFA